MKENKTVFIAYLDEKDNRIEGWFELILDNGIIIKFNTGRNTITLPYNRVLKIKEKREASEGDSRSKAID